MIQEVSWKVGGQRAQEFLRSGIQLRHFFPHRLYHLPKCAPDGFVLGVRMCQRADVDQHWQILLYAEEQDIADLPRGLFFDDELIWHQQHFGRPGQVATAALLIDGDRLFSMAHHADLVQRIGRARAHKTRIEKRFKGWPRMLLNGILAFAHSRGVRHVHVPTSALAMENTDRKRTVRAPLFERVYDHPVRVYGAREQQRWWVVDVAQNLERIIPPERECHSREPERIVCVCHDIERGLGHRGIDERLGARADAEGSRRLEQMLAVEDQAGVRTTYNVVGTLLPDTREQIEAGGHCLAFHSYDHSISKDRRTESGDQLALCRELDYRLKGYRPPNSLITPGLSDSQLALHNFEWLGSSTSSLGVEAPEMRDRLVRLPIALDDFALYQGKTAYEEWERSLLTTVRDQLFTAVSLHDCYAPWWIDHYPKLLERLAAEAQLRTMDEASADVVLGSGV